MTGWKKQQMRKEPDPHQSLKWILKRTKVNRLFQLRRSDCFSVLEPSLISRASCCLKSQHCSRCLTWRVKNPASLYFFLPHRNAMNRFFFQLCSARCISRKQSENVRKTIGTPARCRLAAALKSTWNENDLVFFFLRNDRWFLGGRLVTSTSQQGKSPLAFVTGPASPPNRWRTRAFSISKCWNCCRTRRCLERRKATPLVTGGRGERRRKKKKWRTLSGFDARDPALLCHEMAVDTTPGNDVHFFIAVYVEDAESEVAIFGQEFPSNRTKNRFIKKKKKTRGGSRPCRRRRRANTSKRRWLGRRCIPFSVWTAVGRWPVPCSFSAPVSLCRGSRISAPLRPCKAKAIPMFPKRKKNDTTVKSFFYKLLNKSVSWWQDLQKKTKRSRRDFLTSS